MSTHTITEQTVLSVEDCVACGVLFGIPQDLLKQLQSNGKNFFCPNGHSMSYTTTDATRLAEARKQTKAAERRANEAERRAASAIEDARVAYADRDAERRSHAHTKGDLTKVKKKIDRVAKGVCPKCNRSFPNLKDHMASKHGTKAEAEAVAAAHEHEVAHASD